MTRNGRELGGSFALGQWRVRRAGYGAMQLAGDGVFGPPRDRDEALRVLRAAVAAGVNHIDTAQFYGAGTVNELIREALYPYPDGLAIVSKVGARRDAGGALLRSWEARELRQGIEDNLRALGTGRLAAIRASPSASRDRVRLKLAAITVSSCHRRHRRRLARGPPGRPGPRDPGRRAAGQLGLAGRRAAVRLGLPGHRRRDRRDRPHRPPPEGAITTPRSRVRRCAGRRSARCCRSTRTRSRPLFGGNWHRWPGNSSGRPEP